MNKFSYCWCYDNCGIKIIKILNSFKSEPIKVNSDVNIVPYRIYPQKKKIHKKEVYVKKKKKYLGKIIATKLKTSRFDGSFFNFNHTKCIVFDRERKKFLGSRIYGAAQKELKKNNTQIRRIMNYCSLII
jgi:ribosomal protein L14